MNITALTAFLLSVTNSAALYRAIRNTAIKGHSVAHVCNRHGHTVLAVRYIRGVGFEFTDKNSRDITDSVLSLLKQTV